MINSSPPPLLPVTVVPGMSVVDTTDAACAIVVAVTDAYCICRLPETDSLVVYPWRELALANICPAEPLLSADITARDAQNARAVLLRALLALEPWQLTAAETATIAELRQLFNAGPEQSPHNDI